MATYQIKASCDMYTTGSISCGLPTGLQGCLLFQFSSAAEYILCPDHDMHSIVAKAAHVYCMYVCCFIVYKM